MNTAVYQGSLRRRSIFVTPRLLRVPGTLICPLQTHIVHHHYDV